MSKKTHTHTAHAHTKRDKNIIQTRSKKMIHDNHARNHRPYYYIFLLFNQFLKATNSHNSISHYRMYNCT